MVKFDRDGKGNRQPLGVENCSIHIQMDQNWDQFDPRKAVYILKTIFQYFYYLVFRIHQFLTCVMFHIK